MRADAGIVVIHEIAIFPETDQLTDLGVFSVPTPITEPVMICVELIGSPVRFENSVTSIEANCEAKALSESTLIISFPTALIILEPPHMVPRARAALQARMSQRGMVRSVPLQPAMPMADRKSVV